MRLVLVGNRKGRAAINWTGVVTTSGIVAAVAIAGAGAFMLATNWFSLPTMILMVVISVCTTVGFGIQRSMGFQ